MMLSGTNLALRYLAFAAIAIVVNVGTQHLVSSLYRGAYELIVAMIFGTATGLVTKYWLDKHYIFFDPTSSLWQHSLQFSRYSITGSLTTVIFWATELAFDALSASSYMRYVGAVIGLSLGYFIKYRLDRHFVFRAQLP
jgi:putative flippase GtrA